MSVSAGVRTIPDVLADTQNRRVCIPHMSISFLFSSSFLLSVPGRRYLYNELDDQNEHDL